LSRPEGSAADKQQSLPNDDDPGRIILRFPFDLASDPALFDATSMKC